MLPKRIMGGKVVLENSAVRSAFPGVKDRPLLWGTVGVFRNMGRREGRPHGPGRASGRIPRGGPTRVLTVLPCRPSRKAGYRGQ